jgi:preprotein translocase subunit SecG
MWNIILPTLLFLTSAFLVLLVLIQRGRGGGLAGAFGGLGGQSAFGTKAGDLFTKVTIGVATFWIILCAFSVKMLNTTGSELISSDLGKQAPESMAPAQPGAAPATGDTSVPADRSIPADETAPAEGAAPASAAPAESAPSEAAPETAAPETAPPENKE